MKKSFLGSSKVSGKSSLYSARKHKDAFENLMESAPIGYIIFNENFEIEEINGRAQDIFHYQYEELINSSLVSYVAPEFKEIFNHHAKKLKQTGETQNCELKIINGDNRPVHLTFHSDILEGQKKSARFHSAFIDISERVRMESSLKDNEEKYRLITENSGAIIFELNQNNELELFNEAFSKIFGITAENKQGKTMRQILQKKDVMELEKVTSRMHQKILLPENKTWKFKDRQNRWHTFKCSLNVNISSSGKKTLLIIANDITEQLEAQENYKKSSELYRKLVDNIPDMNMYLFDQHLKIMLADGSVLEGQGFTPDTIIGKSLHEIYFKEKDKSLLDYLENLFQIAIDGQSTSAEYQHEHNFFYIVVVPLSFHGDRKGLAIIRDITEDKNMVHKLEEVKNMAEKANATKTKFLANISHEIRTPLNAIIGFCEQLGKTNLNPQQRTYNNYIYQSSDHLLSIINDMLILSKAESGKMVFEQSDFNLRDLFSGVYRMLEKKADSKGLNFNYFMDDSGTEWLRGDAGRLKQVLINLLNNSIKFTEKGSVQFESTIMQTRDPHQVRLKIEVEDTGIGMPQDKLKDIFDEFKQLDSRKIRKYAGTGLGLSVVKNLVELQNGSISVESKINQGTRFKVIIPYQLGTAKRDKKEHQENSKFSIPGKKILLVEDDEVNATLGTTILNQLQADVILAGNGEEAIEASRKKKYDLILMDIHMPRVSGNEAAREIRQHPDNPNKNTPIIALTANIVQSELEKFLKDGMDDYFLKPFKEKELYHKLTEWLTRPQEQNSGKVNGLKEAGSWEADQGMDSSGETDQSNHPSGETNHRAAVRYDLSSLKETAKGNTPFMVKILDIFINNARDNNKHLKNALHSRDYKQLGEAAHKMVSSYRHLKISFLEQVIQLENKCLHEPDTSHAEELATTVIRQTELLTAAIEKEKKKLK